MRVHPELLERQNLPKELMGKRLWDQRLEAIAGFERYLTRQGTVVLKFFLNVSKQEQKRRFLERLEEPDKHWKFSASDLAERAFWNEYRDAYQAAIAATAAPHGATASVVPADAGGPFSRTARQPDHRAGQKIECPALASLRRTGTGGRDQQRRFLPDSLRGAPGRVSSLSASSRLPCTKRRLVRYTVDPPTETLLAIASSLTPASAASRIWARFSLRTACCRRSASVSCARSASSVDPIVLIVVAAMIEGQR